MAQPQSTGVAIVEEQALATAEQALLAMLAEDKNLLDMWGGENLEEGDTGQPPRIKLGQEDDQEAGIRAGVWYNTLTGENYETVVFVPLFPTVPTRVEYFRPYAANEPPYCASDDGVMPRQSTDRRPLQDPQPGPCKICLRAKWEDLDGNPIPSPLCTRQRNFMLAVQSESGDWEVASLTLQRSGVKPAKRLTALAKSSGIRKTVLAISNFVKDDAGHKYHVPVFVAGKRLSPVDQLAVLELRSEVDRLIRKGDIQLEADETNGEAPAAPEADEGIIEGEDPINF